MQTAVAIETKERPILFSGEMVRQILVGNKTQTRRVVKARDICDECLQGENAPNNYSDLVELDGNPNVAGAIFGTTPYLKTGFCSHNDVCGERIRCPYGKPGDRLWVRETWAVEDCFDSWKPSDLKPNIPVAYRANRPSDTSVKWRPSIFIPRWASRITLEITNVRVERLQDISEEDARAEGVASDDEVNRIDSAILPTAAMVGLPYESDRVWFAHLWNEINGKPRYVKGAGFGGETKRFESSVSWSSNPWVWVIEFNKF